MKWKLVSANFVLWRSHFKIHRFVAAQSKRWSQGLYHKRTRSSARLSYDSFFWFLQI
jgi:hypothetical protein